MQKITGIKSIDFINQPGKDNFNRNDERNSSSFYSKTTFGDTEDIPLVSINIEQLQFMSF